MLLLKRERRILTQRSSCRKQQQLAALCSWEHSTGIERATDLSINLTRPSLFAMSSGYRRSLPQLRSDEDVFLCDAGLETVLVFEKGMDLPEFASFPLLMSTDGRETLRKYSEVHTKFTKGSFNPSLRIPLAERIQLNATGNFCADHSFALYCKIVESSILLCSRLSFTHGKAARQKSHKKLLFHAQKTYLDLAKKYKVAGFILVTPTWRANPDWVKK